MNKAVEFWIRAQRSFIPFLSEIWAEREQSLLRQLIHGDSPLGPGEDQVKTQLNQLMGGNYHFALTDSGRSAITSALIALDLPKSSLVGVPTFCCGSVANSVLRAGHIPYFCDCDARGHLRFSSLPKSNTQKIRAIIVAHIAGLMANDTESIIEWARKNGVFCIEDCAQSFDLKIHGQTAGTFGDISIFSTGIGKNIFLPAGGWAASKNSTLIAKIQQHLQPPPIRSTIQKMLTYRNRFTQESPKNRALSELAYRLKSRLTRSRTQVYDGVFSMDPSIVSMVSHSLDDWPKRKDAQQNINRELFNFMARLDSPFVSTYNPEAGIQPKFGIFGNENVLNLIRDRLLWYGIETESSFVPLHLRPEFQKYPRTEAIDFQSQMNRPIYIPNRPSLTKNELSNTLTALARSIHFLEERLQSGLLRLKEAASRR